MTANACFIRGEMDHVMVQITEYEGYSTWSAMLHGALQRSAAEPNLTQPKNFGNISIERD